MQHTDSGALWRNGFRDYLTLSTSCNVPSFIQITSCTGEGYLCSVICWQRGYCQDFTLPYRIEGRAICVRYHVIVMISDILRMVSLADTIFKTAEFAVWSFVSFNISTSKMNEAHHTDKQNSKIHVAVIEKNEPVIHGVAGVKKDTSCVTG